MADPQVVEQYYQAATQVLWQDRNMAKMTRMFDVAGEDAVPAANAIVDALDQAEQQIGEAPPELLLEVAIRLAVEVADALQRTGREVGQETVLNIIRITVKLWMQKHGERVPPEQLEQLMAEMGVNQPAPQAGLGGV